MSTPRVKITLLVDDRSAGGLAAEHGLALMVETEGRRILMDTGMGGVLTGNAERLGVDLSSIDTVVLSHGHYDHTGGLPQVLAARRDVHVYFHPAVFRQRYAIDGSAARQIGMPESSLRAMERLPRRQQHAVTGTVALTDKIGILAPIARETEFEDSGGSFFLDSLATLPDLFEDDLALWVRTGEGLILLVGCCHAGIINTAAHVRRASGESRIRAIIGGLHLLHADYRRLDPTLSALRPIAPQQLMPCHCTGERAVRALEDTFTGRVRPGVAGAVWEF